MTSIEKERIGKLRAQGFGAVRIAKELSLSVNTVKSHLCRNPILEINPIPDITEGSACKQCGTPLSQLPHRKTKMFCSDACRLAWWNSHRADVSRKSVQIMVCAYCGKLFDGYSSENRKYCSHTCYINDRFRGEHNDARAV